MKMSSNFMTLFGTIVTYSRIVLLVAIMVIQIMEFADCSLRALINDIKLELKNNITKNSKDYISIKSRVNCLLQIARGVEKAHSENIIHADLKLDNIVIKKLPMYNNEIEKSVLKVIDFSDEKETLGTYGYMAPEIVLGIKKSCCFTPNKMSDAYIFGVCGRELLSFEEPNSEMKKLNSISCNAKVTSEIFHEDKKDEWPTKLEDILSICLSHDPSNRPSAAELVSSLKEVLKDMPDEEFEFLPGEENGEDKKTDSDDF
jgi:serine/threonine-protein kinase